MILQLEFTFDCVFPKVSYCFHRFTFFMTSSDRCSSMAREMCVYVCVRACMRSRVYVCVRVCACMHVCAFMHVRGCMYVSRVCMCRMYLCVYV